MNFLDFKCPYSHVKFLPSPKVGSGLKLFFAEFSNDDDDVSFCCTISRKSKHARCCYCEYEGIRVMHPAHPIENYCGGDMDFTEVAHGTHELTNERIISGGKLAGHRVGMSGRNYIYFDPTRDAKLAQYMNRSASWANISWSDILRGTHPPLVATAPSVRRRRPPGAAILRSYKRRRRELSPVNPSVRADHPFIPATREPQPGMWLRQAAGTDSREGHHPPPPPPPNIA